MNQINHRLIQNENFSNTKQIQNMQIKQNELNKIMI
jgi:hypothetical protein